MINVLCIASSVSVRQAAWSEVKRTADHICIALNTRCEFDEANTRCTFVNGSRIYVSGCDSLHDIQKLRGITWADVLIDSHVKTSLQLELCEVIAPQLCALRGPLITTAVIEDWRIVLRTVLGALVAGHIDKEVRKRAPSAPAPDAWRQELSTKLRERIVRRTLDPSPIGEGEVRGFRDLVRLIEELENPRRFCDVPPGIMSSAAGIRES